MTSDVMVTDKQRRVLLILFREVGVTDRDQRLAITSQIVGRRLTTSTDLTLTEASAVIDELKTWGLPSRRREPT